jgi:uncharacterized membrane protein YeaQ/YmgE (transglycosylase-associated protein family)
VTVTGIITAIIIGAIIGALGRLVVPGRQPIPIWLTVVVGIVAAFIGTFLAQAIGISRLFGRAGAGGARGGEASAAWSSDSPWLTRPDGARGRGGALARAHALVAVAARAAPDADRGNLPSSTPVRPSYVKLQVAA